MEVRRTLGEEHPDTLMSMNNLTLIYRDQGKLQEAIDLHERSQNPLSTRDSPSKSGLNHVNQANQTYIICTLDM